MISEFKGFKPRQDLGGFTAIPNEWFDKVLKDIDNLSEMKIVQVVFRKTYGWISGWDSETQKPIYKLEDSISYSQFEELTGLSRASVAEGIKRALAHGLIVRVKTGSYSDMSSSRYRIRLVDDKVDSPEEKEEAPKVVITKEEVPEATKVEEEIKPEPPKEAPKKKPSPYDRYKAKEPKDYNATDMCYYFSDKYNEVIRVWYGTISAKDRSLMKQLIDGYSSEVVVKAIDWLMNNYANLIRDYPSIAVLYGFRTTIFPASQKVVVKNKNDVRQSSITKKEIEEGGEVNVW